MQLISAVERFHSGFDSTFIKSANLDFQFSLSHHCRLTGKEVFQLSIFNSLTLIIADSLEKRYNHIYNFLFVDDAQLM